MPGVDRAVKRKKENEHCPASECQAPGLFCCSTRMGDIMKPSLKMGFRILASEMINNLQEVLWKENRLVGGGGVGVGGRNTKGTKHERVLTLKKVEISFYNPKHTPKL